MNLEIKDGIKVKYQKLAQEKAARKRERDEIRKKRAARKAAKDLERSKS